MPWSEADRAKYEVIRERYSSDLSDEEFALILPLLPAPKRRGRTPSAPSGWKNHIRLVAVTASAGDQKMAGLAAPVQSSAKYRRRYFTGAGRGTGARIPRSYG